MQYPGLQYKRSQNSFTTFQPRSHSPNNRAYKNSFSHTNNTVHSEHLWNMMDQIELFPEQVHQLLKYEEKNLSKYKKDLEREKSKVNQQIENMKRQIIHNIDDLKISIFAELDRIYRFYMEKYATIKGEIMDIKKMKDEIEMDINKRNSNLIPKQTKQKPYNMLDKNTYSKYASNSNVNVMKSLDKGTFQMKKYQMLNYIAQMQKQKIMPLSELSREIVILTEYENGYYQNKQFNSISNQIIDDLKANLRSVYQRKHDFIKDPDMLIQRQEQPILQEIYEENPIPFSPTVHSSPIYREVATDNKPTYNLEDVRTLKVSNSQRGVAFDWAEDVKISPYTTIKSNPSEDIILCATEIRKGLIAVGGKNGLINVYDLTSGQKVSTLRGHRASVCTLSAIIYNRKQYLASGGDEKCSAIIFWDTNNWAQKFRIEAHKGAVSAILDLEDNQSVASGSYDKKINVYNLNSSQKLSYNLPTNKSRITGLVLNSGGSKMISCGLDNTLNVWQVVRNNNRIVETMFLERIIQNSSTITSLEASTLKDDLIFIGTKDGNLKLINIQKGEAYRIINCSNDAIMEICVIERQTKPQYPIVFCWPVSQEVISVVNTETSKTSNVQSKGYIEFGCGIGPKSFMIKNSKLMASVSQSEAKKEVNVYRLDIVR